MPVEALVLDGDHRVADVGGDLLQWDDLAVLLRVEGVDERAVRRVQGGGLDLLRHDGEHGTRLVGARRGDEPEGQPAGGQAAGAAGRSVRRRHDDPHPPAWRGAGERTSRRSGWTRAPPDGDDGAVADLLDDLDQRGLIHDSTDRATLAARLAEGPITLYYGCDPTAPSLHVGNLIGLLLLRRFQDAGHRPVALAGGATGMVGDPSGRSEERNLLDDATLSANVAAIKVQMGRVVDLEVARGAAGRQPRLDRRAQPARLPP